MKPIFPIPDKIAKQKNLIPTPRDPARDKQRKKQEKMEISEFDFHAKFRINWRFLAQKGLFLLILGLKLINEIKLQKQLLLNAQFSFERLTFYTN